MLPSGYIKVERTPEERKKLYTIEGECIVCHGSGEYTGPCPICKGTGTISPLDFTDNNSFLSNIRDAIKTIKNYFGY